MAESTVTSKGQITIPKAIRDALRLVPGDRVSFVRHHDGTVEMLPLNGDVRAPRGIVSTDVRGVTVEDMDAAIGEEVAEQFRRSVGELP